MSNNSQTSAPSKIAAFEQHYRSDHQQEHALLLDAQGKTIVERTGGIDEVTFTPAELNQACLGVLTHNHPEGKPLSKDDLALAARYGLTIRAVGITPDTHQYYEYTAKFPTYSEPLAQAILDRFDSEVERAQAELAGHDYAPPELEREARNLAVERLAARFGFIYSRVHPMRIHEMVQTSHEAKRLDVLTEVETAIRRDVLLAIHAQIGHILQQNTGPKGIVPLERLESVRLEAARAVVQVILGQPTQDGMFQPYTTLRGQVSPNSVYFATLWKLFWKAAEAARAKQAAIMRKYLPPDLQRALEYATVDPFVAGVQEMDEPIHEWPGPDGKRLVDRIWGVAGDLRRRIDTFLREAIGRGLPTAEIDHDLQDYLINGSGGYEALRLARSDTAKVYSRTDLKAARQNPYVAMYQPYTSPAHKGIDICDEMVAGGPYPADDTEHLPTYHPECLCGEEWIEVDDPAAVTERIREEVKRANAGDKRSIADLIGPLSRKFLSLLFGGKL
jgi:hypothetical protein